MSILSTLVFTPLISADSCVSTSVMLADSCVSTCAVSVRRLY